MVVRGASRQQTAPVVIGVEQDRGAGGGAEALRPTIIARIFVAVGGMVGVGLSVGEVAVGI